MWFGTPRACGAFVWASGEYPSVKMEDAEGFSDKFLVRGGLILYADGVCLAVVSGFGENVLRFVGSGFAYWGGFG